MISVWVILHQLKLACFIIEQLEPCLLYGMAILVQFSSFRVLIIVYFTPIRQNSCPTDIWTGIESHFLFFLINTTHFLNNPETISLEQG